MKLSRRRPWRGQSELISAMLLIAVTLAIALAAYGYFITRAASETEAQNVKVAIASTKAKLLVTTDFHYKPTASLDTYYVSLRSISDQTYTFFFTVVALQKSGEYYMVTATDIATVYEMVPDNGLYTENLLAPSYLVPPSMVYLEPYTPLNSQAASNLEIYNITATGLPGETGCEVLLRLDVVTPAQGSPALMVLTLVDDTFYVVEIHTLSGG